MEIELLISDYLFNGAGELYRKRDDFLIGKFLLTSFQGSFTKTKINLICCDSTIVCAEELLDCYAILKCTPKNPKLLGAIKIFGFALEEDSLISYKKVKITFIECEEGATINPCCEIL